MSNTVTSVIDTSQMAEKVLFSFGCQLSSKAANAETIPVCEKIIGLGRMLLFCVNFGIEDKSSSILVLLYIYIIAELQFSPWSA